MKVFLVHTSDGSITSVGIPASDPSPQPRLIAGTEEFVTEMEYANITTDLNDERNLQQLTQILDRYRIDVSCKPPRLVQRDQK
jgi:hypothetical protein